MIPYTGQKYKKQIVIYPTHEVKVAHDHEAKRCYACYLEMLTKRSSVAEAIHGDAELTSD